MQTEQTAARILFLDFDGVLNSSQWMTDDPQAAMANGVVGIDPRVIPLLNQIVDRTGCTVVVSSTWRIFTRLMGLKDILHGKGFTGKVSGTTPTPFRLDDGTCSRRGDEIHEYLQIQRQLHDHVEFVILDDDSDMGQYVDRLVQTSTQYGLTQEHVDKVVAMFAAQTPTTEG